MPPDGYCGDTSEWFSAIQPSDLNACCRSLQEVRIQDTNTSELGVIMLLLFIPNLRSLGGFIYYRYGHKLSYVIDVTMQLIKVSYNFVETHSLLISALGLRLA